MINDFLFKMYINVLFTPNNHVKLPKTINHANFAQNIFFEMEKGRDAKPHIGIFGRRNNGKSSFINALADQEIAIVSEIAGTTTDPVKKSIEIPEVGPAILVDTAGIDDSGELGKKRIAKTRAVLKIIDLAILIVSENTFGEYEEDLIKRFNKFEVPFFVVHNKMDVEAAGPELKALIIDTYKTEVLDFSSLKPDNTDAIISAISKHTPETAYKSRSMIGDLVNAGDTVLLVTPIDTEAPEGRMILPQVQALRDTLDNDCICVILKEDALADYISKMQPKPALVITDSQVFDKVDATVPAEIPMTSFSIMLARHKGDFEHYMKGTSKLSELKDGDRLLILESCTHHVTCDDIGRIKIPNWVSKLSGKKLEFDVVAGLSDIKRDIHDYAIVIQCGGCMITRKQISGRLKPAIDAGIPVTNYGMAIAWVHGIYDRAIQPFLNN